MFWVIHKRKAYINVLWDNVHPPILISQRSSPTWKWSFSKSGSPAINVFRSLSVRVLIAPQHRVGETWSTERIQFPPTLPELASPVHEGYLCGRCDPHLDLFAQYVAIHRSISGSIRKALVLIRCGWRITHQEHGLKNGLPLARWKSHYRFPGGWDWYIVFAPSRAVWR